MPYYYGFHCHHKTLAENLVPIEPWPKIDTMDFTAIIKPSQKIWCESSHGQKFDTIDFTAIIKPSPKIWCQSIHGQNLTPMDFPHCHHKTLAENLCTQLVDPCR